MAGRVGALRPVKIEAEGVPLFATQQLQLGEPLAGARDDGAQEVLEVAEHAFDRRRVEDVRVELNGAVDATAVL